MSEKSKVDISGAEILVVDDTPANIDLLYKMLTDAGYRIAAAPSGEIALKITPELKPDLILLDVMMPVLNGYETCRQLKQIESCKDIPIIFITAKSDVDDIVEGFAAGAVDYISKPIKEKEVLMRVKTHLQLSFFSRKQEYLLEMLKDYEVRNRSIINQMSDALITVCPPGMIESANPAAFDLFGYNTNEIIGKSFHSLLTEQFHASYQNYFNHDVVHQKTEELQREVMAINKEGLEFPIDITIKQLSLKYPLYLVLIHDLSAHKKTINELKKVSNLDQLTQVANRRRFDHYYHESWQQALDKKLAISIILFDIDYFKQYNDNYGHQAGDVCLREVAQAMQNSLTNKTDLVARYGGEEFVLVLPNTNEQQACAIGEQVRANIEALAIQHDYSMVAKVITVSLGILTRTPHVNDDYLDDIRKVDQALYLAKQQGRNRAEVFKK